LESPHTCGDRMKASFFVMRRSEDRALVAELGIEATAETRTRSLHIGGWALAAAVLLFAAVFALRLSVDVADASGLFLLFIVPIVLVTLAYGTTAGAAAASLAFGLVFLRSQIQEVDMGAIGHGMRAVAFYAIPLAFWLARNDLAHALGLASGERANQEDRAADRKVQPAAPPRQLTRRELEVLGLLAVGHTNAEIADKLVLSVRTVESHRASLQRKLGRPSRAELVRYALRRGLLPAAPDDRPAT
jgi:DNA-binding CsgD family transcriptional regulator